MSIVRHSDPDAFLAASLPAVVANAPMTAIFHAFVAGVKCRPLAPGERLYLATWHDGGRSAAAMQRGEYGVFVGAHEPALVAHFADDLAGEHPSLQGVSGAREACEAFAGRWRTLTAHAAVIRAHLRHHVLTGVAPLPAAPGRMRHAADADLEWLIAASLAFVAEAGLPDSEAQVRRSVPQIHALGRYRIWDDGDRVAYAGWSEAGEFDARIGPVYTQPHARHRGYATALVAALSRELLDAGRRRLFLTTDVANPTSNAIYARIGYRPVSDYFHFDFVAPPG
jgi:predicted GNAT family acetyltransferase